MILGGGTSLPAFSPRSRGTPPTVMCSLIVVPPLTAITSTALIQCGRSRRKNKNPGYCRGCVKLRVHVRRERSHPWPLERSILADRSSPDRRPDERRYRGGRRVRRHWKEGEHCGSAILPLQGCAPVPHLVA